MRSRSSSAIASPYGCDRRSEREAATAAVRRATRRAVTVTAVTGGELGGFAAVRDRGRGSGLGGPGAAGEGAGREDDRGEHGDVRPDEQPAAPTARAGLIDHDDAVIGHARTVLRRAAIARL